MNLWRTSKGRILLEEEQTRKLIEIFQDPKTGMIMFDQTWQDGNDGPHKTGFYFGALALRRWLRPPDVRKFIQAIKYAMDKEGELLRHENTRTPVADRQYWQPGSRDQYQAVFSGLGLCWKFGRFIEKEKCKKLASDMYDNLKYHRLLRVIPVCGRDIVSPQHWYLFGLAAGHKQPIFKYIAGIAELVNTALLMIKHSQSANILAFYRLLAVHGLDGETFLHTWADNLLGWRFEYAEEMRIYWTRQGGPPIHLAFLGENDED